MVSDQRIRVILLVVAAAVGLGFLARHGTGRGGTTNSPKTVTTPLPPPQTFSGRGPAQLGTIRVKADSALHWSCSACAHGHFEIYNAVADPVGMVVNVSSTSSGLNDIKAGTYHDVTISTEASDSWQIKITAHR